MARHLGKTCVRGHAHDRIDPCGRSIDSRTELISASTLKSGFAVSATANSSSCDSTAHRMRQCFLQPHGDGNDKLVAAQDTVLCGDVIHAVELYEHKGRAVVGSPVCKSQIQQFQGLGVVRQPR